VTAGAERMPLANVPAWQCTVRYYYSRFLVSLWMRLLFTMRLEGRANLARRLAIYCFGHPSWTDPLVLMTVLPLRPGCSSDRRRRT
jgi:1-acyl-sn-glycerol-3-phosphate acyltransferase